MHWSAPNQVATLAKQGYAARSHEPACARVESRTPRLDPALPILDPAHASRQRVLI